MITYEIDAQQLKKPKKRILEARSKIFLSTLIALILLAFYLILTMEGA